MSNFTSYAAFKTGIAAWLDVSATDLSTQIDDLITVGESRLFGDCRSTDMETALGATIAGGVIAVPTSYISMKYAYVDGSPVQALERRTAEWIYQAYPQRSADAKPQYFARETTNFIFGPYPDSAYVIKGVYYKRLASITGGTLNSLFTANPDLYLFAALSESEPILGRDERIPLWDSKYKQVLSGIMTEYLNEQYSGSSLQMRLPQQTTRARWQKQSGP